jgi:hypothetical protein
LTFCAKARGLEPAAREGLSGERGDVDRSKYCETWQPIPLNDLVRLLRVLRKRSRETRVHVMLFVPDA